MPSKEFRSPKPTPSGNFQEASNGRQRVPWTKQALRASAPTDLRILPELQHFGQGWPDNLPFHKVPTPEVKANIGWSNQTSSNHVPSISFNKVGYYDPFSLEVPGIGSQVPRLMPAARNWSWMLSQATSFWKLSALSTCCAVRTLYPWYDQGGVIWRLVD